MAATRATRALPALCTHERHARRRRLTRTGQAPLVVGCQLEAWPVSDLVCAERVELHGSVRLEGNDAKGCASDQSHRLVLHLQVEGLAASVEWLGAQVLEEPHPFAF